MVSRVSLGLLCLVAVIAYSNAYTIHQQPEKTERNQDAGEFIDIPAINKDLNLFQGDIMLPKDERNALRNETWRWKFPIPYILADNLDLNAKGVILQSFDMFRLKSCVDFKPYEGDPFFIHFQKFGGCWSEVGAHPSGQNLSIGSRCDYKAIVEHEILHALGFYHEQSRTDRDDYVEIWWDEITAGMGHNFNTYDDTYITDLNTPYDYESLMHYGPFSFNKNASVPTITAKITAFNDIIGQRFDMSAIDLERLNRMYNCPAPLALLDQCSFELINIGGMVQSTIDDADWIHELGSSGSSSDHTLVGRCRDAGYYMYFNTHSGAIGSTAVLESRILYPKKTEQCLQFFYKMNGSPQDRLAIWLRLDDGTGEVRRMKKIHTIYGDNDQNWKIIHVTLNADKKFRYMFQGVQGSNTTTSGGILIDDVTLSELPCPSSVWTIRNFSQVLTNNVKGHSILSPCYTSPEGYRYGISVYPHGTTTSAYTTYTGVYFHLCSGEDDAVLQWPALNRQSIMTLLDQDPDLRLRMSSSRSFTTSTEHITSPLNISYWDRPAKTGTWDPSCNCYRAIEWGWPTFISHFNLRRRSYLKNDDFILFLDFVDLTQLIKSEVPVQPAAPLMEIEEIYERKKRSLSDMQNYEVQPVKTQCDDSLCLNGGVCVMEKGKASCRCRSSQAFMYIGERCEIAQLQGNVLGMIIGGVAGTIAMTIAVFAIMSRK